jgi:hypothetical protein
VSYAPALFLLVHLISSIGVITLTVLFLSRHWLHRYDKLGRHTNSRQGYIALICILFLVVSGLALLRWTNVPAIRWLHAAATAVLLVDLTYHIAWRLRQQILKPISLAQSIFIPQKTQPLLNWFFVGLFTVCIISSIAIFSPAKSSSAYVNVISISHASHDDGTMLTAETCVLCHSDLTQQWGISAHRNAATDKYYQSLSTLFIEEQGVEAVRYCATCHNPIGLMQGEVDVTQARKDNSPGNQAYQARKLGVNLSISKQAAEGVTCVVCHRAAQVTGQPVNGSLQLDTHSPVISSEPFDQLILRAAPISHKEEFMPDVIHRSELCGSCHNLYSQDGKLPLEPTFDEWKASPYAQSGISCQDCHMPSVAGNRVNTGWSSSVSSHGGVPGAPSSLTSVADNASLLQNAATLELSLNPSSASQLIAVVRVTNSGAGHYLPTGSDDLRQVWLEVELRNTRENVLWSSGKLDQFGALPPDTVRFGKVLGDAKSRPIDLHRFWIATQIISDTRLSPLETRQVLYYIPVDVASQPHILTVRLLYQDVSRSFAEFALERAVPLVPVREMATSSIVVDK